MDTQDRGFVLFFKEKGKPSPHIETRCWSLQSVNINGRGNQLKARRNPYYTVRVRFIKYIFDPS